MLFDGRIIAGITVFVAVARTGSYARASELLGLSRSGVGKAIGRLEERIAVLERIITDRGLALSNEIDALRIGGEAPARIIEEEGLAGGLSPEALTQAIQEVLSGNADKVAAYRAGKTALLGFFTGQVMRATAGKADPATLSAALAAALQDEGGPTR